MSREDASTEPQTARRHHRFPLRSTVEFSRWDPKNNVFGYATDISVAGAFVETAFPALPGSQLVVRVWPPGWPSEMLLAGVVRWSTRAGMGIEFSTIGPREALGIHALIIEYKAKAREAARG